MGLRLSTNDTIYGVSNGPFKLNPTAGTRRRRRHCTIHLGSAKADVFSVEMLMTMITPATNLEAGEWVFETVDGLLKIENLDPVTSLVPETEGDTTKISMDVADTDVLPIFVNVMEQPTQI